MDNSNQIPENIRLNLKKHQKHTNTTCLECGYVGLVGIIKEVQTTRSRATLWIAVIIMFFLGMTLGLIVSLFGLIVGGLIGLNSHNQTKTIVECPKCLQILEIK